MLAATAALLLFAGQAKTTDQVKAFVQRTFGTSAYERADVDLNGDRRTESLIYLTNPDHCGSGGCSLVILSPGRRGYRVVMRSTVTRLPISLLSTANHGWRDIGVTVEGGGITRAYQARMRFNGRRYPSNPTVPPAILLRRPTGRILIAP
ncbi:MAG: hypothetical protein HOP95_07145 [Sphingomonas sp.]|nr:hypothetical protein [Sphingomonas sp.]